MSMYGHGAGNTAEENTSIFSAVQLHYTVGHKKEPTYFCL